MTTTTAEKNGATVAAPLQGAPATQPSPPVDPNSVNLLIDGKQVTVPKGTNLIEAAKKLGIDIPHYCYHPHLSVAGNCRMCQVRVKNMPKMEIACNAQCKEGMEVQTHLTSQEVADTQAAVLEMILINHPLDCTVCDQAGHCKLQDYHYEYNARASRFVEEKEHKVKAEPLGPTVMLDGERCIMCTRCIRFCDEVTKTSELGMLNRGDRSVIAINPGRELNNPLSGTVVDLCPVGALTHREWRFNSRIWFTKQTDSICPGCSTGCNVRAASRRSGSAHEVVLVKGRMNDAVNKEWLCDEGRYGFHRFLPTNRMLISLVNGKGASIEEAIASATSSLSGETLIFVSPDLLVEDYSILRTLVERSLKGARVVIAYRERTLTPVEKILVSPDYASNVRGAEFAGLCGSPGRELEVTYENALKELRAGQVKSLLTVGDRAIFAEDFGDDLENIVERIPKSVGVLTDAENPLARALKVVFPGRSILEKAGLMVNRQFRMQYTDKVVDFPDGTEPDWRVLTRIAHSLGAKLTGAVADRELTLSYLATETRLVGLTISLIKAGGIDLQRYTPGGAAVVNELGAMRA